MNFYQRQFTILNARLTDETPETLDTLCAVFQECQRDGGKVILIGNGGSAATASHVSVDLTKAAGIRSICFNESDLITCYANDYGYEHWAAKALESYADRGDVVVLISASGRSQNLINAATSALTLGLTVVTLSGFDGDNTLRAIGHLNLWVNSRSYNVVELVHQAWLLVCVDKIAADNGGSK